MQEGTTRRMCDGAMRHMGTSHGTRDTRRHLTTTENCHAALHRAIGVTRVYQSDTSSKQPSSSVFFRPPPKPPPEKKKKKKRLLNNKILTRSVHISPANNVTRVMITNRASCRSHSCHAMLRWVFAATLQFFAF